MGRIGPKTESGIRPEIQPDSCLAVVVFSDATDLAWLRCLARGFRHCFVFIRTPPAGETVPEITGHWTLIDPLSHYTRVRSVGGGAGGMSARDLAAWYRGRGFRAVVTRQRPPVPRAAPLAPYTCVEAVKRTLGIRNRWVYTPRQLYKYLLLENNP